MRSSFCVLLLLAMVRVAAADSLEEAKKHYERANAAYALGRFGEAAIEYEKAFDLKPDSALLYNAAQAYRIAGNKWRALLLYQSYLRVFGDQVTNADDVKRRIITLKQAIDAENQRPPQTAPTTGTPAPPGQNPLIAAPTTARAADVRAQAAPAQRSSRKRRAIVWGIIGGVAAVGLAVGLGVGLTYGRPVETTLPKMQYP